MLRQIEDVNKQDYQEEIIDDDDSQLEESKESENGTLQRHVKNSSLPLT